MCQNSDPGDHIQYKFQQKNFVSNFTWSSKTVTLIPDPETLHKFHKGVLSELISHRQPSSWVLKSLIGAVM